MEIANECFDNIVEFAYVEYCAMSKEIRNLRRKVKDDHKKYFEYIE